jgi:molybdate transport system substrate-binding protein
VKRVILTFLLTVAILGASEIKIAVAANVSYAIEDLKKEFYKLYPDTKVQVILGSSGKLMAQITNGAPYHLFMSANMMYPEALYEKELTLTKPVVYAKGMLAMLSIKPHDFSKGIALVQEESIKRIAVAKPTTAPYGKAAIEAMKNATVYETAKSKFVFAESVSQTVSYTITAADLGFIAKSSLYSPKMKQYEEGVNWKTVDPKFYMPIKQGIVILKNAESNDEAKAFYTFILSDKAKEIFKKFGYLLP